LGQHAHADRADVVSSGVAGTLKEKEPMLESLDSTDGKRIVVLGVLLSWCVCMIAVRMERTGSGYYRFLVWNLFLAGVPLLVSTGLRYMNRRQSNAKIQLALFGLWLLFLPNAPYILTDILHLTRDSLAPAWYDLALLLSCAGTGLLFGYLSLSDVHSMVAKKFGATAGWLFAMSSLILSGFAIYLGRFLRWNSWDVVLRPTILFDIADGILHPLSHTKTFSVTLVFGILLTLGYISLRLLFPNGSVSSPNVFSNSR
jgi:uncharacterized membrane protein